MPASARLHRAYVGLGSNLDDPVRQLKAAFTALEHIRATRLITRSSLYGSAPVGKTDQPDFVNAVAVLETELPPVQLLDALLQIELEQRRIRHEINGPRTLDLDLLLYDQEQIGEPRLQVPHARMHERAFVLIPLLEVNPNALIPGKGLAADWLPRTTGQSVHKLT
jgi:2-amino-4-hydroxy-6-hydroxymethyldihydropteridine diphosphokinase